MATNFPTNLQDMDATRGTANDRLSQPSHVTHHQLEDDTIEALQAKVGIDNSADTSSIDYLLKNAGSVSPGHKHALADIVDSTGLTVEVNKTGTYSLTTTANQRVIVFAKAAHVGTSGTTTVTLAYNGVTKDSGSFEDQANGVILNLMYSEVPGAATHNVTLSVSPGSLTDIVMIIIKVG